MRRFLSSVFLIALLALSLPGPALCQAGDQPTWLVVTDVSCQPEDSPICSEIFDALQEGLAGIEGVEVAVPGDFERIFEAMGLPAETKLTGTTAHQAAVRAGIPLMVEVELVSDGVAYSIETRLMDPENGTVHFRTSETASSKAEIAGASDQTVVALFQGVEEALPSVTNRQWLSLVSTPSLEALKLHTEAAIANGAGQYAVALPLLEQAVEVDPNFAAGWRLLSVVLSNLGQEPEREVEAVTRAYELSRDLPEYERLTTAATYYASQNDYQGSVEALEEITERFPDRGGWNNLGLRYAAIGEYEKARDALQEAVNRGHNSLTTGNLITAAVRIGDLETARDALQIREDEGIGTTSNLNYAATIAYVAGDREEARRFDLAGAEAATTELGRAVDLRLAGYVDAVEGRVDSFRQRFQEANEIWSGAGNSGTVFDNREFLALFDAIVLEKGEQAGARLTQALQDAVLADAPMDPFDAGTVASLGMPDRAKEILAEWEANTSAGLRVQFEAPLHRFNGYMALADGRTEEGLKELGEAVKLGFDGPFYVGEMALAYDRAGMPDLALEAFHRFLEAPNVNRRPSDALFLGRAYERLGQLHEARGEMEDAVKFHTLFVELWAECDPELEPRVEAARRTLARLRP